MWVMFAFLSAFFAGITTILAKCGIQKTDSTVATAIRTIVVLIAAWLLVFLTGSVKQIGTINVKTWTFLILSGLATGASWLCYFKALKLGDVNKVVPIDKSSVILTIVLAWIIFGESIIWQSGVGVLCIGAGTFMMIEQKKETDCQKDDANGHLWLFYAFASAVFASLVSILGKIGISGVDSNLGTAIRTCVVLFMAFFMVFVEKKSKQLANLDKKELVYIVLSGFATGASWLCYYRALQDGPASVVVPIDKLSIVVSIVFSFFVLHERLTKKATLGLVFIVVGTLTMLF